MRIPYPHKCNKYQIIHKYSKKELYHISLINVTKLLNIKNIEISTPLFTLQSKKNCPTHRSDSEWDSRINQEIDLRINRS